MDNSFPFEALYDIVIVEKQDAEDKVGDIVIPTSAQKDSPFAKVVAVGPGKIVEGCFVESCVKVGDTVLLDTYAGREIDFEGKKYSIVRESEIVARLR